MLKGIPPILSPELLKVLCEMGHSDRIVIGDGNFPAETMGKNAIVIRCDGHGVPELLDAILQVFPLDSYVEKPVSLMQVMPGDTVVFSSSAIPGNALNIGGIVNQLIVVARPVGRHAARLCVVINPDHFKA